LVGGCGESFVQCPGALLRKRLVQLIALRIQRLVQLVTLLFEASVQLFTLLRELLVECVFSVPAGYTAAEILRNQRNDQGEDADTACDDRRSDLRAHERNLACRTVPIAELSRTWIKAAPAAPLARTAPGSTLPRPPGACAPHHLEP